MTHLHNQPRSDMVVALTRNVVTVRAVLWAPVVPGNTRATLCPGHKVDGSLRLASGH